MYDLIIIGGGASGMSAAIYAARYNLKTLIISKEVGGVLNEAHKVGNWPGSKEISGLDLMTRFKEHVDSLNIDYIEADVQKTEKKKGQFIITANGKQLESKTIILAFGLRRNKLNIEGEDKFAGKGVSYCYTCDAPFYRNKIVGVVGGSDSAALAALLLAQYAKKVFIIYRGDGLRAEPINKGLVEKNKNIELITKTNIIEVKGDKALTTAMLDKPYKGSKELNIEGLFIEIGSTPSTVLAEQLGVKRDQNGFIIVNKEKKTNVDGVYAAGDATDTVMRQVITAAADGAIAAMAAFHFMKEDKVEKY
ncbi:MAG: FAD-dependent oxidoreductase [Candidatus Woesearchaeota archaeon]|nr:FAD-dependent oxidoreductase [Candidatus Woesearchaeota archaeon]